MIWSRYWRMSRRKPVPHPFRLAELGDQVGEAGDHIERVGVRAGAAVYEPGVRGCQHDQGVDEDPAQSVRRQVPLERPGVTAQLLHRGPERLPVGRVPSAARDLDPAVGALDVDQRHRVLGDDEHVDLVLTVVPQPQFEVVQHHPVRRAVVAQVPDDGALGVVDGLSAADDLSHRLSRPPPSACALSHHLAANPHPPHRAPPRRAVPAPGPQVGRPRPATGTPAARSPRSAPGPPACTQAPESARRKLFVDVLLLAADAHRAEHPERDLGSQESE